jgi:hypothetical protein
VDQPSSGALPRGGLEIVGVLASGSRSASSWTDLFNPFFGERFGITFVNGSLNLELGNAIEWENPRQFEIGGRSWEFCPIVLDEQALGVAFRGNRERPDLLEIASPVGLRARLGDLKDGARIRCRLLSGQLLRPAA